MQINKNVLSDDQSPYLKQHKDNPVFWQKWNKETLEFANKNKKPILLSIGYASCHWCHVMAHESFEDVETAQIMNQLFVNIKVDREERPDLDFVFQSSYQLFNQTGGGWPLTMFLDENGVPFMGGTYFPKDSKHGLPSFKEVLQKVSEAYKTERENIIKQKDLIIKNLDLKKTSVLNQDLEPILELSLNALDTFNGGYKGAPKFPTFNLYETLLYYYNKSKNKKYLEPIDLILKQLCSKGIYDHVEGGIARYTVDENWIIPHFEKMLYDNTQFISLLSKYCRINHDSYFKNKLEQTIEFLKKDFINKDGFLGSAYDADSDGEEGKYYVYTYEEIKELKNIERYFEIKPEGNWENKIILVEKEKPTDEILNKLLELRSNRAKPFFDSKTQLDLNCLWVSSLVTASEILPNNGYLKLAEEFFSKIEKKYINNEIHHSYSKNIVFIEDYAFLVNALNDLSDKTMNYKYKDLAKKIVREALNKFYLDDKNIFQKNLKENNDIFYKPIDIGDNTIPNGNAIMLINLIRLGMMEEAKKLSESLNGYLNIYKNHMMTSLKAIDFFNNVKNGKNCDEQGCYVDGKKN
ncbi:thioredoxin domain-containing protein [Candidatus Pelagibacter bacterium]|nr:thioredoxin domain-containing protein [Candidatus Pelagibacter bacterium]